VLFAIDAWAFSMACLSGSNARRKYICVAAGDLGPSTFPIICKDWLYPSECVAPYVFMPSATLGSYTAVGNQSSHMIGKVLGHKSPTATQISVLISATELRADTLRNGSVTTNKR
jgi:hypothetical protein